MEKYFKRKLQNESAPDDSHPQTDGETSNQIRTEFNMSDLPSDPGLRPRIMDYSPNIRDQVRRKYLLDGPTQPQNHNFPQTHFGQVVRRFNPSWFNEFSTWLEYSKHKDAAFCLCCYLFKAEIGDQAGGDSFVGEGFSNWKKKFRLRDHVGGVGSSHNKAWAKGQDLLNQRQHIETIVSKQSDEARSGYRIRLDASVQSITYLLKQGLAFRGHDESEDSPNQGNFLEFLKVLADNNEHINAVVLKNAPVNLKLIAPSIQKDIVNAAAFLTTNAIIRDLGHRPFCVLLDESRDISMKEQMAVVLRYVDKKGCVVERFLGLKHVTSTSARSLKIALEEIFSKHGLSISHLRGQGYDGASNMKGEFNGLKTIILQENECAYYVHCFAHQLQLALVAVAKNHVEINSLFYKVSNVVNVVGASCKRRDNLREKQAATIIQALENDEISCGKGLNQESSLARSGDTRWGSHYHSLISLISLYSPVIEVVEMIEEDGDNSDQRREASYLLDEMRSFEFVFNLHLMRSVLGITDNLSQALQRKDQDIVNAMGLVKVSKKCLQDMRKDGWSSIFNEVCSFCGKHRIDIPIMDNVYTPRGRSRRRSEEKTNLHHYQVELFYTVIDRQFQELSNRFNEVNTKLLLCVACLNPYDSFSAFDKQQLVRLAQFYPRDFSEVELLALNDQLVVYITDMRFSSEFCQLKGISELAQKMIESQRDKVYPFVYKLITLALILPVATATVERAFSAMKIVKNRMRNRMGDEWMNDSLVVYVEKDVFSTIDKESILQRFQCMKTRRGQL